MIFEICSMTSIIPVLYICMTPSMLLVPLLNLRLEENKICDHNLSMTFNFLFKYIKVPLFYSF